MTSRPSIDEVARWVGLVVQDSGGEELGRCIRAYRDDETGQAEWLVIETRSGSGEHFVPTRDARQEGGAVRIAWTEAVVLATPSLGSPDQVSVNDEGLLYAHYGIPTPAQDLEGGSESGQGQARSRGRLVRLGAASDTDTIPPADLSSESADLSSESADLSSESVEPLVVTSEPEEAPATAALAPQASAPQDEALQDEALQDEAPVAATGSPEAPEPIGTDAGQQPETASQTSTGRGARAARAGGVLVPVLLAGAAGAWRWQRVRQQRAAKQRAIRIASGSALLVPAAAAAAIFLGRRRQGEDAQWQRAEETPAVPVVIDLEQERGLRTETPTAAESLEQTDSIDLHEGLDIPTVRDPDSLR